MENNKNPKEQKYDFEELSSRILNSAIKVHRTLGPGFLESIYHKALAIQLQEDGLKFETQKEVKIYYFDKEIGTHILDLLVENEIIVELKTIKEIEDVHLAQIRSYLKATNLKVGLILNFAKGKLQIKRVVE